MEHEGPALTISQEEITEFLAGRSAQIKNGARNPFLNESLVRFAVGRAMR